MSPRWRLLRGSCRVQQTHQTQPQNECPHRATLESGTVPTQVPWPVPRTQPTPGSALCLPRGCPCQAGDLQAQAVCLSILAMAVRRVGPGVGQEGTRWLGEELGSAVESWFVTLAVADRHRRLSPHPSCACGVAKHPTWCSQVPRAARLARRPHPHSSGPGTARGAAGQAAAGPSSVHLWRDRLAAAGGGWAPGWFLKTGCSGSTRATEASTLLARSVRALYLGMIRLTESYKERRESSGMLPTSFPLCWPSYITGVSLPMPRH